MRVPLSVFVVCLVLVAFLVAGCAAGEAGGAGTAVPVDETAGLRLDDAEPGRPDAGAWPRASAPDPAPEPALEPQPVARNVPTSVRRVAELDALMMVADDPFNLLQAGWTGGAGALYEAWVRAIDEAVRERELEFVARAFPDGVQVQRLFDVWEAFRADDSLGPERVYVFLTVSHPADGEREVRLESWVRPALADAWRARVKAFRPGAGP